MPPKEGFTTTIAREARIKAGAQVATLTLAKRLYKKHPKVYSSVEHARTSLRTIEGKIGKARATAIKDKSLVMEGDRPKNPYKLGETWGEKKPVFTLPIGCNRIGFISDTQVPFQDNEAIYASVKWLQHKGVNTILVNGDAVDFYGVSSFQKDPRKRNFKEELDAARNFYAWLRAEFPTQTIYTNLDSNHDLRWERWLIQRAPELLDIHDFDLCTVLQLNQHNIIPLKNNDYIMIGKLVVLHGHTLFGRFGSMNKARTVFNKVGRSCIASHVHHTDEFNYTDIHGELHTTWTTGCLMSLAVEYNQHGSGYNHGFAYIETENDGTFRVENKRIQNGKVY